MTVTTLAYIPSPAQGVWFIGPVPLRAYALCIIIGIVAALVIGDRRWEARGGERGVIYDIALWAVPFGLVGGRLYHVLTDWPTYFGAGGAGLGAAFRIWDGGLGIWGAVALGAVGAWIGCRQRGIPLPAFGDAVAPGIILAQAIGRLGNYFNQELYGRATTLPWGLEIYERRDAAGFRDSLNGVSTGELVGVVHPTFLYELLWNLLIFALLIWIDRRYKLGHGRVFALYVAGYCLGRFWIELMRSDTATLIAGIRVNSFTSTFIFIAAVVYVMVAPKGREDPATLRGDADDGESIIDELAIEAIAVGAVPGVVAAAKVADADDAASAPPSGSADSSAPDADDASSADGDEADVADAADEADEVEEAVETTALVVPAGAAAEGDVVAGESATDVVVEPATDDAAEVVEDPATDDVVEDPAVAELAAEEAEGDVVVEESADAVVAPEAEVAEAPAGEVTEVVEDPAVDESAAEEPAEEAEDEKPEGDVVAEESADVVVKPETAAEPEAEAVLADAEVVEAPADEATEAVEDPAVDESAAEEAEGDVEAQDAAEETAADASDPAAEPDTSDQADEPAADEPVAEAVSPAEDPAPKTEEPTRKRPRWFRRNS